MKKYIKSERANLFEPNVYISMIASIEGRVTCEDISSAVKEAYQKNEATLSKIVLEDTGEAYYKKMQSTGCKVFFDTRDWEEIIQDNERKSFAINEGELVRTFVICGDSGYQLLIMAHHLVGDGKSVLILLQDILDALAGNELVYKPMELLDEETLFKKTKLPLGVSWWIDKVNARWRRTGKVFAWDDYYAVHKSYWEKHSSKIEVKTYSAETLKRECNGKATLNSFLVAKLLEEYPKAKVIGVPISIREETRTMANLTSGIAIKYQYDSSQSFDKNLVTIHSKLQEKLKNIKSKYFVLMFVAKLCPSLVDAVLLEAHDCYQNNFTKKMAKIMGYTGSYTRELGVTNLMKIDIASNYDSFQIKDVLFIPPKVSYSKNVVGICTYQDKLQICYHKVV